MIFKKPRRLISRFSKILCKDFEIEKKKNNNKIFKDKIINLKKISLHKTKKKYLQLLT